MKIFTLALLCAAPALAQDALKTGHYKVELENDYVRVVRSHYGAHEKSALHDHGQNPAVIVVLRGGKAKYTLENGESIVRDDAPGHVAWSDGTGKHAVENLDAAPHEAVRVELKSGPVARYKALVRRYFEEKLPGVKLEETIAEGPSAAARWSSGEKSGVAFFTIKDGAIDKALGLP